MCPVSARAPVSRLAAWDLRAVVFRAHIQLLAGRVVRREVCQAYRASSDAWAGPLEGCQLVVGQACRDQEHKACRVDELGYQD